MILQGGTVTFILCCLVLCCPASCYLTLRCLVSCCPNLRCLILCCLVMKPSGCCHNIKLFGITNTVPIIARGLTKINSGLTRLTGFLLKFYLIFSGGSAMKYKAVLPLCCAISSIYFSMVSICSRISFSAWFRSPEIMASTSLLCWSSTSRAELCFCII